MPRKNIAEVAGKPLIAHSIVAARAARSIERTVVSTDDVLIAEMARLYGAEVPFFRPAELAQDDTPGIAPVLHAIKWLEDHENYRPEFVLCLQPTSPLRTAGDIDAAVELVLRTGADAVVSVTPAEHSPYWLKSLDADGRVHDFITPDRRMDCRQDLPALYALNGAIYLARREILLERETWYMERTYAYVMPRERSLDIDEPWDLHLTELILKDRGEHKAESERRKGRV